MRFQIKWLIFILSFFLMSSSALHAGIKGEITSVDKGVIKLEGLINTIAFKMGEKIEITYMAGMLEMMIGEYEIIYSGVDTVIAKELSLTIPPEKGMKVLVSRSSEKVIIHEPDPGAMLPPSQDPRFYKENKKGNTDNLVPVYNADRSSGEVIKVTGTDVHIKLTSPGHVKIGYIATLKTITSFGMERHIGTWKIHTMSGDVAIASVLEMETQPGVGAKATLSSPKENISTDTEKKEDRISPLNKENKTVLKKTEPADPLSQNKLGMKYQKGTGGVSQDYEKAVYWYRKAANQGDADGQNNMGWMYQKGLGVKMDLKKALYWYKKAADQGYAVAQYNVGLQYKNGQGTRKNTYEAVVWFLKSARQGYERAQNRLGECYQFGAGVNQDHQKAVAWYRKSADQGYAYGQSNLGWMYLKGLGVTKNLNQAVYWIRKAADKGHAAARNTLGTLYLKGIGVELNRDTAIFWYRKAVEKGNKNAIKNLERLGESL